MQADSLNVPTQKKPIGLSPTAVRRVRRTTVTAVTLLALMAAILSFEGLRSLALDAGIHPNLAWLLPLVIDGLVIVGSLGVITATLAGTPVWYFWLLTLLGVTASVFGNIASAPQNLLAQTVHALPPLVFALSIEGLLAIYRASAQVTTTPETPSATAPQTPTQREERETQPPAPADTTTKGTAGKEPTAREKIRELLENNPDITGAAAATTLGINPSHARKLLREERPSNQQASPAARAS